MEDKKYLNEETFQKNKKKITRISLIVLIVGVVIGLGLIITGLVLSHNATEINIDLNPKQENTETLRTESEVQADINTIQPKINSLQNEIAALGMELWGIQMSEGMTDNYYTKQQEKETKETELLNLDNKLKEYKNELSKIQSNNSNINMDNQVEQFENIFNMASNKVSKSKYIPFYMFGAFVIIASCMISLYIYLFAKRREIMAFTTQQVMPVAKEGIDEMAPTVGSAVGSIGKELAKGIKEGVNEANKENKEEDQKDK